jgi:hypothetical protein
MTCFAGTASVTREASSAAKLHWRRGSRLARVVDDRTVFATRGVGWALDSSLLLFGALAVSRRHRGPHMNSRALLEVRGEVGATDREPRTSP